MTSALGIEIDCPFTPSMLRKVAYSGTQACSFKQAADDLKTLAEVECTAKRVERWTERVGNERVAEQAAVAEAYQVLPLPERQQSPTTQVPQVACVMMDGGRIQIRDRQGTAEQQDSKGYWKESLVGCLLSMTSEIRAQDPCPTIPKAFVDPARMHDLSREIKGFSASLDSEEQAPEVVPAERDGRPEVLVKSVVATRRGIETFGPRLIAAAHARGFNAAGRRAFVADGGASNWSVHQKYFSHYTPVLDFTHAVCYVYGAAMAGRTDQAAWQDYACWAQWLWEGAVDKLIEALARHSEALGLPHADDPDSSPRKIVAEALRYLRNQQTRMHYGEYRKQGLPITSSHIESTIKQINRRVKGTEKFWDQGAEPILQLAADHLSETPDFDHFWKRRPKRIRTTRCYQTAS